MSNFANVSVQQRALNPPKHPQLCVQLCVHPMNKQHTDIKTAFKMCVYTSLSLSDWIRFTGSQVFGIKPPSLPMSLLNLSSGTDYGSFPSSLLSARPLTAPALGRGWMLLMPVSRATPRHTAERV